jgi:uncharacterized protein (TIGR03790 family)
MLTALLAQAAVAPANQQKAPIRSADLADRVLVVYNKMYGESGKLADYYMAQRRIPAANKCAVDVESPGANNYIIGGIAGYHKAIKEPLEKCLNRLGRENILYIVFSYSMPFKVWDAAFPDNARAIDSLVADIWSQNETAPAANPYYRHDTSAANISVPFQTLQEFRNANPTAIIYSVWRLDAPSVALAKGLVDKAIAAAVKGPSGQGCFDRRYPTLGADKEYGAGDWDIQRSADLVAAAGFPVTLDTNPAEFGTAPAPIRCENAAFYGGWYSYGHYNDAFSWVPGAMGWHLDSLSLGNPRDPTTWSGGALARGITVTTGVVSEPYLDNIPHLDTFYKAVLAGATVGDAILRSTRALKWMNLNVGDPLYAPFASTPRLPAKTQ